MAQRLIQEIRRREKVIRIFPNKASAWRLVGALLAEKHEEWSTGKRCWTMETSSMDGEKSRPTRRRRNLNQNPRIALFNQPDRQGALHKIFDLTS